MENIKPRILVVDDEGIIAMHLQLKLRTMGYDVPAVAYSAEQAIDKVAELKPDIVLMDINLGVGMDGIEGAALIRDQFGTPVVFLTAYADNETLQRAKIAEPYGYIVKPFTEAELRIAIEIALYKAQTAQRLRTYAAQQATIAKFSQQALSDIPLQNLMELATKSTAAAIAVDCCTILELLPDERTLLLRAGVGWREGSIGQVTIEADPEASAAGYALVAQQVIIEDFRTESRFQESPLLCEHDVVSGANVVIHYLEKPFGVLGAYSRTKKDFAQEDIDFLQSIANVITQAIQRDRARAALQEANENLEKTVTERTAELSRSELKFRSIVESANSGIVLCASNGRITDWNPGAEIIFGYSKAEVLGQPLWLVIPEYDQESHHRALDRLRSGGHPRAIGRTVELKGRRQDGTEFPVELSLSSWGSEDEIYFSGIISDITKRKQDEAEIHQAREEAERANQAKSEFLSRMSHELRTPLNAILGFGQILDMEELSLMQKESVSHIVKAGRHLLTLINEVLDIARVEAGKIEVSLEAVAVAAVVERALGLLGPLSAQRNIRLEADLTVLGHWYVLADEQRFMQVVLNLLSNAVKYNRDNGKVTIEASETDAGLLRIKVCDTGIGIAPPDLAKLFLPFERLGANKSEVEGTGLGLALSRSLMHAMGGSISVDSVLGQGTTFCLELPLAKNPLERLTEMPQDDLKRQVTANRAKAFTMLYIEDNMSNYRLIQSILDYRPGVELIGAMQGGIGLDLARQHRPNLILLDLHLPDIMGHEVLRRLRQDPATSEIPVVVLSADATPHQIERLLTPPEGHLGARAYLTKPLDVGKFLQTLDALRQDLDTFSAPPGSSL